MRHSRMERTMNDCTDPTLPGIAGAVTSLPAFVAECQCDSKHAEPA